jgi:tRNA threonylcarbamoyladenosine biosynthesis protein TsaE
VREPAVSIRVITTESDADTRAVGRALAPLVMPGDVVVLSGDLGAGKTQLTKGLATGLGVSDSVTSPTFNLLLVHEGRIPLYHFDLYRLEHPEQLDDLDYWGTLEADGVSVVEWGDRFAEAIPDECVVVRIRITGDDTRALEMEPRGDRGQSLAAAWTAACDTVQDAGIVGERERS